jgi:hypothetical protein
MKAGTPCPAFLLAGFAGQVTGRQEVELLVGKLILSEQPLRATDLYRVNEYAA